MLAAIMVADKSKLNKELPADHPYKSFVKRSANLDSSPASSSDNSLKSKSDHDVPSTELVNEVTKNELNDEYATGRSHLNCTYNLCRKPDASSDSSDNLKSENDERSALEAESLESNSENSPVSNATWNFSNFFNLTEKFEAIHWNSELYDLKMDDSRLDCEKTGDSALLRVRNYLAEYQEMRGTPCGEYTFSTLIRFMGQATGSCLLALFHAIINIAPVFEVFLHIARFIVDKVIDIKTTTEIQYVIAKTTIFSLQVLCIYICLVFIFGFIVSPVLRMVVGLLLKIMLYN